MHRKDEQGESTCSQSASLSSHGIAKGGLKSWPSNWEAEMKGRLAIAVVVLSVFGPSPARGQAGNEARAAIDSLIARAGHTRTEYSITANSA